MTTEEKKTLVKVMVDDSEMSDNVVEAYLNIAGQKIISVAFPFDHNQTGVPERYEYLQCRIATYLINKRGAEGETSHSENGISRAYEDADIPASMLSEIIPKCGVVK